MPDSLETLGFNIEFFTNKKGLENLKGILDGTLKDINEINKALLVLNGSLKGSYMYAKSLAIKRNDIPAVLENEKKLLAVKHLYSKINNIKKDILATPTSVSAETSTTETPPVATTTTASSGPTGEKVYKEGESIVPPKKTAEELKAKVPTDASKIITKISGEGDATVEYVTTAVADEVDKIVETTVKNKVDSLKKTTTEKIIPKSTYDPASFSGLGTVVNTKIDEATKAIIQITEERVGDILKKRTYRDGKLIRTQELYRPIKETIPPSDTPTVPPPTPPKMFKDYWDETFGGKGKKGAFSKFMGRIKNIVLYRLVRVAMSAISKSLSEGFSLLGTSNKEYKDVLNDFKTASTSFSVAMSSIMLPAAQSLSSMLESLSTSLINTANSMALANAQARNQTEYFKLDSQAIEEYSKTLSTANKALTQIDKFATLSENKPVLGNFVKITDEEVENMESINQTAQGLVGVIDWIVRILSGLGKIIEWINGLSNTWKAILGVGVVAAITAIMLKLNPVKGIFAIIFATLLGISAIINDESIPKGLKVVLSILTAIAGIAAFIFALLPAGKLKLGMALASASAVVAALGTYAVAQAIKPKTSVDTASAQTKSPSLTSYGNALEGNALSDGSYSQQVLSSTSDVYLDRDKVGKALTKTVVKYSGKAGI